MNLILTLALLIIDGIILKFLPILLAIIFGIMLERMRRNNWRSL